jgi:large subunit ribosomal protein L9
VKIILLKKVEKLGERGEVVEVKRGYARNKLIPEKIALPYTEGNMRKFKELLKIEDIKKNKAKRMAMEKKEKLDKLSITIPVHVGEDEKLFGSITNMDIQEALKKEGYEIDKKNILLENPIKELGVHSVEISLHPEVKAKIKIWVVSE